MLRRVLVVVAALALVPTASAAGVIERAADELANDLVYVDPAAGVSIDESRVEAEIESSRPGPFYVAVLPPSAVAEAGGDPAGVVAALYDRLGPDGTYVAAVGRRLRAGSTLLPRGTAGRRATAAIDARRGNGLTAILVDLVDRVAAARANGSGSGGDTRPSGGGWILPALLVGGLVFFLISRSRKRMRQNSQRRRRFLVSNRGVSPYESRNALSSRF